MTARKQVHLTRREALAGGAALTVLTSLGTVFPTSAKAERFGKAPEWMRLLGVSEEGGRNYTPRVEGKIPEALSGVLYRNGPGLFERGTDRKAHLLDGDGLIQRLSLHGGMAHYRNEFVRTPKFREEEAAGRHLYATWTTRAPGGMLANLGAGEFKSQAGVTVYAVGDKIYALDEMNPAYEIDPDTLATLGPRRMGEANTDVGIKAHTKLDPQTGDWILAGAKYGRKMELHTIIYDKSGKLKTHQTVAAPRQCYFHDFFASENYVTFLLHPLELGLLGFLSGTSSFTDSLEWDAEKANLVVICPKNGGEPIIAEAPASFMWHSLNAFERDGELFLDFTGYTEPDHFVGEDALLYNLMEGRLGEAAAEGHLKRYRIDLETGRLEETILDTGNHEFGMIDLRGAGSEQSAGYLISGDMGAIGNTVNRYDYSAKKMTSYRVGDDVHVGEPIFMPRPGGALNDGWLIVECLDGGSLRSFFAILDASHVEDGPVAKIWLEHHVPISFHGVWKST